MGEGKTFTDCSVRTYRWHTVLAVVFAPLDEANPLSALHRYHSVDATLGVDAAQLLLLWLVLLLVRLLLIVTASVAKCHYSICNSKHLYNLLNTAPCIALSASDSGNINK